MTARLIAFTGYKGHGKSTAATALCKYGAERVRFAGPLKRMMYALGLTEEHVDGALKEKPCAVLGGKTPRHAMQTLGTQWGRDLIYPSLWIDLWKREASFYMRDCTVDVVVDDLRFPNEAEAVRELGGLIVRIERPGHPVDLSHESERGVADIRPDTVILNGGPVSEFAAKVTGFRNTLDRGGPFLTSAAPAIYKKGEPHEVPSNEDLGLACRTYEG